MSDGFSWAWWAGRSIKDVEVVSGGRRSITLFMIAESIDAESPLLGLDDLLPHIAQVVGVFMGEEAANVEPALRQICQRHGVPFVPVIVTPRTTPNLFALDVDDTYREGRSLNGEEMNSFSTEPQAPFLIDKSAALNLGWEACSSPYNLILRPGQLLKRPETLSSTVDLLEANSIAICASSHETPAGPRYEQTLAACGPTTRWHHPCKPILVGSMRASRAEGHLVVDATKSTPRQRDLTSDFKILYLYARRRQWEVSSRVLLDIIEASRAVVGQSSMVNLVEALMLACVREETSAHERSTMFDLVGQAEEDVGALDRAIHLYEQSLHIFVHSLPMHSPCGVALRLCRARFARACEVKAEVEVLSRGDEADSDDVAAKRGRLEELWHGVITAYDKATPPGIEVGRRDRKALVAEKIHVAGALSEVGDFYEAHRLISEVEVALPGNKAVASMKEALASVASRETSASLDEDVATGRGVPWISVLTTPKRQHYLEATLRSLDGSGASCFARSGGYRAVFVDGNPIAIRTLAKYEAETVQRWPSRWCVRGRGVGTHRAMMSIIMAAARSKARCLGYFEDDVLAGEDAVAVMMNEVEVPDDCAFLSFTSIKAHDAEPRINHAYPVDTQASRGDMK